MTKEELKKEAKELVEEIEVVQKELKSVFSF